MQYFFVIWVGQVTSESATWRLERLRGSPLSVSWVHCLAPGAVMSIVWERGNDPRQMENNNVSPPLLSGCWCPCYHRRIQWLCQKYPTKGCDLDIWGAILFHLDCFMLTRFHDCMIIGNESDPMNFLILLIETRPCNFIDLESFLNNAICALKNWTQTDLVL